MPENVRPEYPDVPTRPSRPTREVYPASPTKETVARGWWSGFAGLLGGVAAFVIWFTLVKWAGSSPTATYADGASAGFGLVWVSAGLGYCVYWLLTLPYWVRERRAGRAYDQAVADRKSEVDRIDREHAVALAEYGAEIDRIDAEHAAAVEKYQADYEAYREADEQAWTRRYAVLNHRGDNA